MQIVFPKVGGVETLNSSIMKGTYSVLEYNDIAAIVKKLKAKKYANNSMGRDGEYIKAIRNKLRAIVSQLFEKFNAEYGDFQIATSSGNPLSRGGVVNRPWATLYKGSDRKQYAAQITIGIDADAGCLDVGFYFGKASSHDIVGREKIKYEKIQEVIAQKIVNNIRANAEISCRYNSLGDLGFIYSSNHKSVTSNQWLIDAFASPKQCQIYAQIYPDSEDRVINFSTIDYFVSQIIFLMKCIDSSKVLLPPLTPEQWAKKAELLAMIGYEGELFVLKKEKEKVKLFGFSESLVKHMSLISDSYGYDIASVNNKKEEIYIEVKTTTRLKSDPEAQKFFLSNNEYQFYSSHKDRYKLVRVFGIRSAKPEMIEVDMSSISITPNGYVVSI